MNKKGNYRCTVEMHDIPYTIFVVRVAGGGGGTYTLFGCPETFYHYLLRVNGGRTESIIPAGGAIADDGQSLRLYITA